MKINSIVRVSMQGVSRPYVCQDENGQLYWCKGNHTGLRALMSEWICARIAHSVELPVPECFIAKLEVAKFNVWSACNAGDFPRIVTESNQYIFASKNVELAKDVVNVESDLRNENCKLLAKIYLFDEFIHNTDRTDYNSNLLINHGVHVIDHNNAFDPFFDCNEFSHGHILRTYLTHMLPGEVDEFRQRLHDVVTEQFLDAVWSEMPVEWTDVGDSVFSLNEVKRVLGDR